MSTGSGGSVRRAADSMTLSGTSCRIAPLTGRSKRQRRCGEAMNDIEKIKHRTLRLIEHSHVFSPAMACEYGVECAIILGGLRFWIGANRAEGRHEHEGHTWAYFS